MKFKELSSQAKERACEDYLKESIYEDLEGADIPDILAYAPQYDYNEDGSLNKVI